MAPRTSRRQALRLLGCATAGGVLLVAGCRSRSCPRCRPLLIRAGPGQGWLPAGGQRDPAGALCRRQHGHQLRPGRRAAGGRGRHAGGHRHPSPDSDPGHRPRPGAGGVLVLLQPLGGGGRHQLHPPPAQRGGHGEHQSPRRAARPRPPDHTLAGQRRSHPQSLRGQRQLRSGAAAPRGDRALHHCGDRAGVGTWGGGPSRRRPGQPPGGGAGAGGRLCHQRGLPRPGRGGAAPSPAGLFRRSLRHHHAGAWRWWAGTRKPMGPWPAIWRCRCCAAVPPPICPSHR